MTDPALAVKVPGRGRMYRHPVNDELYPSVTNIIDVLDKPAIPRWAAREVAKFAYANRAALMTMDDGDAAVDFLKGSPYRKRDKAADVGSVVHSAAEALATNGELPALDEVHGPFLDAFLGFVKDFEPKFQIVEGTVFSEKYQYAGTFDFLAWIRDFLILGDHKTGSGVYAEVALQLSALRHAETVWDPKTGELSPMPWADGCIAVHLQPGKATVHVIDAGEVAFQTFLGLRQAWPWVKDNRAVGPVVNAARLFNEFSSGPGEPQLRESGLPSSDSSKTGDGPADSRETEPADPTPDEKSPAAETAGGGADTGSPGTIAVGESLSPAGEPDYESIGRSVAE